MIASILLKTSVYFTLSLLQSTHISLFILHSLLFKWYFSHIFFIILQTLPTFNPHHSLFLFLILLSFLSFFLSSFVFFSFFFLLFLLLILLLLFHFGFHYGRWFWICNLGLILGGGFGLISPLLWAMILGKFQADFPAVAASSSSSSAFSSSSLLHFGFD